MRSMESGSPTKLSMELLRIVETQMRKDDAHTVSEHWPRSISDDHTE